MHNFMATNSLYCCYLFFILLMAKAKALSLPDSSHASLSLIAPADTNQSNFLPIYPDRSIGYSAHYLRGDLPDTACMMVCVFAMRELALLDITDTIAPKTWVMDEFPEVALSVGNPGDSLGVRWAMFTIALAIKDMMIREQYEISQFNCTYLGIKIGQADFLPTNTVRLRAVSESTEYAVPQISGGAITASSSTAPDTINIGHSKLNASLMDDDLHADLTYRDKEISKPDMTMAIIWTLLTVAPHQIDERIITTSNTCAAITASVTTSFIRVRGCLPRLQLRYGSLASLMAKLPLVLLQANMFRELDIVVRDNGVVGGRGTIRSADLSGSMEIPLTPNVSYS